MKTRKRQTKNNFGDEVFIPGIPDMDMEFEDYGFGTIGDNIEEVDYNLFDYDRTDVNTDARYMRPRPTRMPSACVRYDNAQAFARKMITQKLQRVDAFVSGSFIFGDFIEALLTGIPAKAVKMTISTLSMSKENVDSLELLMDKGYIDNLRLMISDYFYGHERRGLVPYIYKHLDKEERFQLGVARVHTKTCHFLTLGGKKIVCHGSANLRSSINVEQITIEEDPQLYDFYEETYDLLFNEFATINHSVSSRSSWGAFEKILLTDTNKNKEV